jgi:geranylgeranyl diphosphate synthase, type I
MVSAAEIHGLISKTDTLMRDVLNDAERAAAGAFQARDLPMYDVVRYHLGWVDQSFAPTDAHPGKRVRPSICLLVTGAAGGDPEQSVPVAAAIELLHNFTLMHDDIQDRSRLRRGRPTVWANWGEAQAINAGDAAFALSQLALLRLLDAGVSSSTTTALAGAFNRVALRIVEGQVLDLGFEDRWDITADDYLRMISGKTAAIVAFASWAGARIAGHPPTICERYHEFGRLLGLGFQVRDDFLGIWGESEETGKHPGDDVRGRKKSIPIVMLLDQIGHEQADRLREIYASDAIDAANVAEVMALLDSHGIDQQVQALAADFHDRALVLLEENSPPSHYSDALLAMAERLVDRSV